MTDARDIVERHPTQIKGNCPTCGKPEATDLTSLAAQDGLVQFAKHKNWELDWGKIEDDPIRSDRGWRVHVRQGNINDREWTLIGHGDTPQEAIAAALASIEVKS